MLRPAPRFVLLLGALGASLPLAAGPAGPSGPSLRVVAVNVADVPALSLYHLEHELARVLSGAGVRLRWRAVRAGVETGPAELRVTLLASTGLGADHGRGLAGVTGRAGAAPAIWIYYPNVVRGAGLREKEVLRSPPDQRGAGIALGRVVAHEIVHALAPEIAHDAAGLMRPRLAMADLGSAGPWLTEASARALREGAEAWALTPPVDEGRLALAVR